MNRFVTIYIDSAWYKLNVDNFEEYSIDNFSYNRSDIIITFQTSDLIRHIKSQNLFLPTIIDLEAFDKQMAQEGKEFRHHQEWRILTSLRYHNIIDNDFKISLHNIKQLLEYSAKLFLSLYEKDLAEKNRFEDIELRINKIIYKRQLLGVKVDRSIATERCNKLEKYIYNLKNTLQLHHNIFSPDQSAEQVNYLKSKGFKIVESLLYTFKIHRNNDIVCNLFYELIRSQQDLDSLLYISAHWGGSERTYPTYMGFGTITSRITLRQPSLQNLRKSNRDIIIADDGMRLLYPDFSQFEAGILASLSDDENLLKLYNSDIYSDLAEKVLNDKQKRSEAKVIFYRYMYGDTTLDHLAKNYFNRFSKLKKYRESIEKEILSSNKIGTTHGNFRYLKSIEDISWSLSHVVQAHASLIYKKSLIRVNKEIPKAEFLIPMHDATLYQIDKRYFEEQKEWIKNIYVDEFKKVCPQIEPRINFDNFYIPI